MILIYTWEVKKLIDSEDKKEKKGSGGRYGGQFVEAIELWEHEWKEWKHEWKEQKGSFLKKIFVLFVKILFMIVIFAVVGMSVAMCSGIRPW